MQMLMILTVSEKLHTMLFDFTNVFAQAKLKETINVQLPKLYESPASFDVVLNYMD